MTRRMAVGGVALLSTLPWLSVLLGGTGVRGVDLSMGFLHIWGFAGTWLRAGELPMWNPHTMSGEPFFGEPHGLLYPPGWPVFWLSPAVAVPLILWLHTLLGGLFTLGLVRSLGRSWAAALLGAALFMFSGNTLPHVHAGHVPQLELTAWLPGVLWATVLLARRATLGPALALAAQLALMFFTGHVQFVFYTLLLVAAWLSWALIRRARRGGLSAAGRLLAFGGLAGGLALGLMALQLVPMVLWSRHLARVHSWAFATEYSLHPAELLGALIPDLFGDEVSGTYWGPHAASWETTLSIGVLGLGLAALMGPRVLRRPGLPRLLAVTAVATLLLALGDHLPLYGLVYDWVPGFSAFRVPSRILVLGNLAVCVLAALGLDRLRAHLRRGRLRPPLAVGGTLVAALVVLQVGLALVDFPALASTFGVQLTPDAAAQAQMSALFSGGLGLAVLGGAFALAMRSIRRGRGAGALPWAWAALAAAELLSAGWRFIEPAGDTGLTLPAPILAAVTGGPPCRTSVVTRNDHLNLGLSLGFDTVGGYEGGSLARYNAFMARALGLPVDAPHAVLSVNRVTPPLRLLNLCHLLVAADTKLPPPRFTRQVEAEGLALYDVAEPQPRAWVVSRVRQMAPPEILEAVLDPRFDPRAEVLLESPPTLEPEAGAEARTPVWSRPEPDRLVVDVPAGPAGHLVLSEIAYPGWEATVDAVPVKVQTADFILRAVPVPARACRVEMTFTPPGRRVGEAVSGAALAGLLTGVGALAALRRRRSRAEVGRTL